MQHDIASVNSEQILQTIFEHAARIGREQDISELVRLNSDFARDLAGADRCSLWLVDQASGELWTKVAHGVDTLRIPMGEGLVGACVRDDAMLLVNNAADDPRLLRRVDKSSGYRTEQVLCVPMRADGQVIGALQLLNKPSGFTSRDAAVLGLLGQFAASAIQTERLRQESERARLLRHELDLAREVQARLLPGECNSLPGIEAAGFCRPANSVGGDYYDLIPLPDGSFAFTLGDVSGKGVPAAVTMASIQTLLRSLLERDPGSLGVLMRDLNRALHASSAAERYSTLFCGVISADRGTLTYVNAGQVLPLLLHRNGGMEPIEGSALPIGIFPSSLYETYTKSLAPGDLIVVVSDGMMEVCNASGDFWNDDCVADLILKHADTPVCTLGETLCRNADTWACGAPQYDDMTVVAVRLS